MTCTQILMTYTQYTLRTEWSLKTVLGSLGSVTRDMSSLESIHRYWWRIHTTYLEDGVKPEDGPRVAGICDEGHVQFGVYTQILMTYTHHIPLGRSEVWRRSWGRWDPWRETRPVWSLYIVTDASADDVYTDTDDVHHIPWGRSEVWRQSSGRWDPWRGTRPVSSLYTDTDDVYTHTTYL